MLLRSKFGTKAILWHKDEYLQKTMQRQGRVAQSIPLEQSSWFKTLKGIP